MTFTNGNSRYSAEPEQISKLRAQILLQECWPCRCEGFTLPEIVRHEASMLDVVEEPSKAISASVSITVLLNATKSLVIESHSDWIKEHFETACGLHPYFTSSSYDILAKHGHVIEAVEL